MKAFLEEYGLVIVVVVVLAMLIIVARYVSDSGKKSLEGTFDKFNNIGETVLDKAKTEAEKDIPGNSNDKGTTEP